MPKYKYFKNPSESPSSRVPCVYRTGDEDGHCRAAESFDAGRTFEQWRSFGMTDAELFNHHSVRQILPSELPPILRNREGMPADNE